MQNVTHIAPGDRRVLLHPDLGQFRGRQAPLAYLDRPHHRDPARRLPDGARQEFPSAGGYFTYVSRTLGPAMGFLTGWVFVLYSPVVAGPSLAVLGQILQDELARTTASPSVVGRRRHRYSVGRLGRLHRHLVLDQMDRRRSASRNSDRAGARLTGLIDPGRAASPSPPSAHRSIPAAWRRHPDSSSS
jgi:hypothetical protein